MSNKYTETKTEQLVVKTPEGEIMAPSQTTVELARLTLDPELIIRGIKNRGM
jgi:hypothetical protein